MGLAQGELGRLGMTAEIAAQLCAAMAERDGLILIAGPPGSGRSTTVQTAVDAEPLALAVGEICDAAGAGSVIATAATAPTLARIDAAHSVEAISRLRELRIDPFTIASKVRAVFAQRLTRRLCPDCRVPAQASARTSALLGFDPGTFLYEPGGCRGCEGTGYRGRIGLFEGFRVDGAIQRLIGMDGDEAVIASHAFRDRPNLAGAARAMLRQGLIGAEDAVSLSRVAVRELV